MVNDTNSDFAVKRQLLQMQMLYEIGLAINESLDPIQVVDEILNRAMVMIDARVGLLIIKEDGESRVIGQVGTDNDLTAILQLPEVAQAWRDSQLRQHQIDTPAGRHLCIVPLESRGETGGILVFVDKEHRGNTVGPFEEQDKSLLHSFAYQAGASLHNARLYESLDAAYEELKIAQRKLAQMEQLRALGDLGAQVAHSMNHILGIITGHADMYLNFGRDPDNTIQTIMATAESGQGVMERIQQFARLSVGKKRVPVDISSLIQDSVADMQTLWHGRQGEEAASVDWVLTLEATPATYANPTDLKEVFSNIVLNALEAMPGGGQLEITCRERQGSIFVSLRDTGIGMHEETQQQIFTPFFSTNEEWGTGLGLAIAYHIVADHEGEIEVESTVDEGSCFTIRVPIQTNPPTYPEEHDAALDLDS